MKKKNPLSRARLETLSTPELLELADEYGVDIPDDLDRQFIIGDLLELSAEEEEKSAHKETIVLSDDEEAPINVNTLPESYNETKVSVLLRNPVSLFVWWDLSEWLLKSLRSKHASLKLAVYFFNSSSDEKPSDAFDIQISFSDREQYVLIPGGKNFVRVDVVSEAAGRAEVLCNSELLPLWHGSKILSARPGEKPDVSRIIELSGAAEMLRAHYNNYRQSFY